MSDWYFCVMLNSRLTPTSTMIFCDIDYKKVYARFFMFLWRYMVNEFFAPKRGLGEKLSIAIYCSSSHPSNISKLALKHIPNFRVSRPDWWSKTIDESFFKVHIFNSKSNPMSRLDILKKGYEKVRDTFIGVYNGYLTSRLVVGTCMLFFTRYESRDNYLKRCADSSDVIYDIDTDSLIIRPARKIPGSYHLDATTAPKTGWWYAVVYYESRRHDFGYNTYIMDGNHYTHVQNYHGMFFCSQDFDEVFDHYMTLSFNVRPLRWNNWCIAKTLVNPFGWDPCMFLSFPYLTVYMNISGLHVDTRYAGEFPTTYTSHPAFKALARYKPNRVGDVVKYNPKTNEVVVT